MKRDWTWFWLSYSIRYGVDDAEHEFDGCVFDGWWNSDIRDERRPALLSGDATPFRFLFDPAEIVRITAE